MSKKLFYVESLDGSCPPDSNWAMQLMTPEEIAKFLLKCIQNKNDIYALKIGEWFFCKVSEGKWFSPGWDHRFDMSIY